LKSLRLIWLLPYRRRASKSAPGLAPAILKMRSHVHILRNATLKGALACACKGFFTQCLAYGLLQAACSVGLACGIRMRNWFYPQWQGRAWGAEGRVVSDLGGFSCRHQKLLRSLAVCQLLTKHSFTHCVPQSHTRPDVVPAFASSDEGAFPGNVCDCILPELKGGLPTLGRTWTWTRAWRWRAASVAR
jgi:hypothetical protein